MNPMYPCSYPYSSYYNNMYYYPSYQQSEMPSSYYKEETRDINVPGILPTEQSYVENILRLNLGKIGTFYMTYEGNTEWNAKVFKGKVEAAGRDHIVISDPETGKRYVLLMINLDYITFDEELNYVPPGQVERF